MSVQQEPIETRRSNFSLLRWDSAWLDPATRRLAEAAAEQARLSVEAWTERAIRRACNMPLTSPRPATPEPPPPEQSFSDLLGAATIEPPRAAPPARLPAAAEATPPTPLVLTQPMAAPRPLAPARDERVEPREQRVNVINLIWATSIAAVVAILLVAVLRDPSLLGRSFSERPGDKSQRAATLPPPSVLDRPPQAAPRPSVGSFTVATPAPERATPPLAASSSKPAEIPLVPPQGSQPAPVASTSPPPAPVAAVPAPAPANTAPVEAPIQTIPPPLPSTAAPPAQAARPAVVEPPVPPPAVAAAPPPAPIITMPTPPARPTVTPTPAPAATLPPPVPEQKSEPPAAPAAQMAATTPPALPSPPETPKPSDDDAAEAMQLATQLEPAAQAGDRVAQYRLAILYALGKGVPRDYDKAAALMRRAADAGLPDAEYDYGVLCDKGLGVPKNSTEAAKWYAKAAQKGHPPAALNLGYAYAEGIGVTRNLPEAAKWFRRAAEAGLVNAQFNLAYMYEQGAGLARSPIDAYAWYSLAAQKGDRGAQDAVGRLTNGMSAKELTDAKLRINTIKKYVKAQG